MLANTDATGRRQQLKPDPERSKEVTELLVGWSQLEQRACLQNIDLLQRDAFELRTLFVRAMGLERTGGGDNGDDE